MNTRDDEVLGLWKAMADSMGAEPNADMMQRMADEAVRTSARLTEDGVRQGLALAASTVPHFGFLDHIAAWQQPGGVPAPSKIQVPTTAHAIMPSLAGMDFFDVNTVRKMFPVLGERVHGGKELVWLDNAATTQKPQVVIDRISRFYATENSNIHRAAHELAARASDAYEAARKTVARFIGASSEREIVFTRGTTESVNLLANTWGKKYIGSGDEIILTQLEHHSNIVPWQMLAAERGAKIKVAPVDNSGQIILEEFQRLLGPRVKLASITHVSNALGTILPIAEMIAMAHRAGAKVMIDAAQSVAHIPIDVQQLDADWLVFSGHKIYAPTGIGALYGKEDLLNASPPWQGGGNMISDVTFEKTSYHAAPMRFEAGTGNIADAVGLGAALDFLSKLGLETVGRYEHDLLQYGNQQLATIPGLKMIGTAPEKAGVMSFNIDGWKSEDVGKALDREGIAVRAGHHCAQPALRRFGHETSVRPSVALYNTKDDIDCMIEALRDITGSRSKR